MIALAMLVLCALQTKQTLCVPTTIITLPPSPILPFKAIVNSPPPSPSPKPRYPPPSPKPRSPPPSPKLRYPSPRSPPPSPKPRYPPPSPIYYQPMPMPIPTSNQWLTSINAYRLLHHAPPVQWSATLAQLEQAHTDACVFAHSIDQYGENLGLGYASVIDAVNAWYNEVNNYDYNNPGFSMNTGHFTQLVWVNTKYIGCSQTVCPQLRATFYGCKFDPPGNYNGQYQTNVL